MRCTRGEGGRGRTGLLTALVVLGTIAATLPFRAVGINLADEGFMVQIASDLLAGRRLYGDAVVYAWPGAFYLTAAAFAVFGESMLVARTTAVVVFGVAAGAVFLLARWFHGARGALVCAAVFVAYRVWAYPHWHMMNYSSVAMALVLVATWLAGQGLGRSGACWPLLAGLAAGMAVTTKQDIGVTSAGLIGVALLALLPRPRLRTGVVAYGIGLVVPFGVMVAALAWQGVLGDAIRESILVPMRGIRGFSGYPPRPSLWPLFVQDEAIRERIYGYLPAALVDVHWATIVGSWLYRSTAIVDVGVKGVFYLPWTAALAGTGLIAARVLRRHARSPSVDERRIGLLVLVVVASQAAFNPPRDWVHLLVLYPPTIVLLAGLAGVMPLPTTGWGRMLRAAGGVVVAGGLAASVVLAIQLRRAYDVPVRTPRGTLNGPRGQAEPLQALVDDLARKPGGPLLVLPYHPLPNFLVGRRPPTRHYSVWPAEEAALRDAAIIAGLRERPETSVVYCPMQVPYYPRPEAYAGRLFEYLADEYETVAVYGGGPVSFSFLRGERMPSPAGRRIPLRGSAARARYVRRPASGPRWPAPPPTPPLAHAGAWPFERTLVVQAPVDGWIDVPVDVFVQAGDRFAASVSVPADALGQPFTPRLRFSIHVDDALAGELAAVELNPRAVAGDRGWVPITADLAPWAGRRVRLLLRTARLDGHPRSIDRGGWGEPRIVGASVAPEAQPE